uniref:CUB domain-containing protein n=1 Tax=Trichogramma kaykai TaxID=54128 RepID=A0ABD2VYR9_9HYME
MNRSSRWSSLLVLIFILLKCGTTRPMLALEDANPSPRLVVAASHTALSGDLGVLIIDMPLAYRPSSSSSTTSRPATTSSSTASSRPPSVTSSTTKRTTTTIGSSEDVDIDLDSVEEDVDYSIEASQLEDPYILRVFRLDGFTSELIGEVPLEQLPNVAGVNVSLVVPCGFFSRGGSYSLQLQHKSSPTPERFTDTASLHDAQMWTTLDVRWPTPSLALEPQHLDTYPSQPVLATLEYTGISCAPAAGVPVPAYTVQLIYCGASVLSCDPRNKSHVQMLYKEEVEGFPIQRVITLRCEFFGLAGHYALRLKPSDPSAPTTSAYIKVEWSDLYVFNVHARSIYPCDASSGGVAVLFQYPACRLAGDRVRVYGRLRADVASLAPPSTLHYVSELKAPPGKHQLTFDCDLFTERYVEYCFVYISQAYNGAMSEVRVDCIPTFPLQESDAGGWGPWSQWTPCSSSCVGGTRNRHRFCDTPPPRYGAKFCQGETVQTEPCGGSSQLDLRGAYSPGDWECRHGEGLAADRPEVTAEVGDKCRCGCSLSLERDQESKILAASSRYCPGRSFWLVQTNPEYILQMYFDQARFPCQGQYARVRDGDLLIDELLADIASDKKEPASGQIQSSGPRLLLEFYSQESLSTDDDHQACLAGFLVHVSVIPKSAAADNRSAIYPATLANAKIMAAASRWAIWLTPAHLAAASLLCLMFLVSVFLALQYAFKYRKYQVAEDLDSLTDNSACSGSMQGLTRRARAVSSSTLISEVVSLVRLPRRGGNNSPRHARLDESSTVADIEEGYESTETQPDGDEESLGSGTLKPRDSDDQLHQQQPQRSISGGGSGSLRTIVAGGGGTAGNSVRSTPTRRSSVSSSSTTTLAAAAAASAGGGSTASSSSANNSHVEVKYARPVKLRTFGPVSPVSEEGTTSMSEDGRRFSATSASNSLNNGFSPASSSSNSTLRRFTGKESKERRNRERLLAGPGSEFSLANQDTDLELDYYDYNVVNAGAAPGSYLGMDPAFLVWIPPIDDEDAAVPRAEIDEEEEEPHYEEIAELRPLDTEGAALTPAEYRKVRSRYRHDESSENDSEDIIRPRKLDPGECKLHDEIIQEYKARLGEGMLPIHRILEESRVRVSEESLSSNSDAIPNRAEPEPAKSKSSSTVRLPKRIKKLSRWKLSKRDTRTPSSESSTQSLDGNETGSKPKTKTIVNDLDTPRTRRRYLGKNQDYCDVNILNNSPGQEDISQFNGVDAQKSPGSAVNIPMAEFSRNKQESPVKVHGGGSRKNVTYPSPDNHETKPSSFYALIGEGEDGIKFADDDDEYIDNKVVA